MISLAICPLVYFIYCEDVRQGKYSQNCPSENAKPQSNQIPGESYNNDHTLLIKNEGNPSNRRDR